RPFGRTRAAPWPDRGGLWPKKGGPTRTRTRRGCDTVPGMAAPAMRLVAVVDDEDGIRESVCYALTRDGHRAVAHADGLSAWAAFSTELPDLAILDIGLPGLDGLELCRRLRSAS